MSTSTTPPSALPGVLHQYIPKLKAFEYSPQSSTSTESIPHTIGVNTLLFIGGLGDDILSPSYVHESLAPGIYASEHGSAWRVVEVGITSSGHGWGTGSVKRDAEELAKCIEYFRKLRPNGKIVMMGHSSGCQDIMYLLTRHPHPPHIDGIILQAPISDREAILHALLKPPTPGGHLPPPLTPPSPSINTNTTTLLTIATSLYTTPTAPGSTATGPATILPIELTAPFFGFHNPISAARWYSLTVPPDPMTGKPRGEEDFFSSDIPNKWLAFADLPRNTRVLVLYSEEDEFVPVEIDKEELVGRWIRSMRDKGVKVDEVRSGVVEEANHDLRGVDESVVKDVVGRVVGFLGRVEGHEGHEGHAHLGY